MGLFDGCLLVSDIDGTLLTKGIIPSRNIEAIDWFRAEGGVFALATGRVALAAKYSYEKAHANPVVLSSHGGLIYDFNQEKILYHRTLDEACKSVFFDVIKQFPFLGVEVFSGLNLYEYRTSPGTRFHIAYEDIICAPLPEDITEPTWTKVIFMAETEEELFSVFKYCQKLSLDFCRFVLTSNTKNARYLEMLPPDVNKGNGLKELKRLFGAKRTYGIGDFYNDLELIRDADVGAATAEAPEELKSLADYVTGPCKEGAVADFIEQIALERKGYNVWKKQN